MITATGNHDHICQGGGGCPKQNRVDKSQKRQILGNIWTVGKLVGVWEDLDLEEVWEEAVMSRLSFSRSHSRLDSTPARETPRAATTRLLLLLYLTKSSFFDRVGLVSTQNKPPPSVLAENNFIPHLYVLYGLLSIELHQYETKFIFAKLICSFVCHINLC